MALKEPRLDAFLLETSQAAKEQLINELIIKLVAIATGEIKSKTTTAPPGNAIAGDAYIVPANATGAWANKTDRIAYLAATGAWVYLIPPRGQIVYVRDQDKNFRYDSGWSELIGGGDMLKADYDTDDDGIVDNSELLGGQNSAYYRARANHTGTQPLTTLSQSGATADQVVTWNGSAWVAADTAPTLAIKDEGNLLTSEANSLNFTGAGVTATNSNGAITVSVPNSTSEGAVSQTTAVLSPNLSEQAELTLGRANVILRLASNRACRVRFYLNNSYRASDASRPLGVDPVGEHGVLLEIVTNNINSTIDCAPLPIVASSNSGSNLIPITITNLDQTAGSVTININYLSL